MAADSPKTEKNIRSIARSIALVLGLLCLVLFFYKLLFSADPKPKSETSGLVMKFDASDLDEQKNADEVKVNEPKASASKVKSKPTKQKDIVKDEDAKPINVQKQETPVEEKNNTEASDILKKQIGAVFNKETKNKVETGDDSTIDELLNTESGTVGGGLSSRGGSGPKITDKYQAVGIVVLKVCVNEKGAVISAKYTQQGSTTSDGLLREIAEKNAKQWTFNASGLDKQCGTITYNFKVR